MKSIESCKQAARTCKDCILEKDCELNTEACERFKDKKLYSTKNTKKQ